MSDLVTGGAGFLGYHLARGLSDAGRDVVIVDNMVRSTADPRLADLLARPGVTFIEADLCDPHLVNDLPSVERVFHLAAHNGTQNFYENPHDVIRNSTIPTLNLLERYAKREQVSLFTYTGSSESYAAAVTRGLTPVPTPEDTPLIIEDIVNPRWSYAAGKLHGEIALATAADQFGVPWQIWRVHNCFGPRMGAKHVIPDFTERALRDVFELYGHADTRTFLYVDDAVDIMQGLAASPDAMRQVINVGGRGEMTMLELGQQIMKVLGKTGDIDCKDSPKGSVARRAPDVTKLLGLLPEFAYRDFDASLKLTLDSVIEEVAAGHYSTK